jgi:hypothetical protein
VNPSAMIPVAVAESHLLSPCVTPSEMMAAHKALREWVAGSLRAKTDFDLLPGTSKQILLKPGIDKIAQAFRLIASFEIANQEVDHDRQNRYDAGKWVTLPDPGRDAKDRLMAEFPGKFRRFKKGQDWFWQERQEEVGVSYGLYRYVVICRLTSATSGEVVAEGMGICSTMEAKYVRSPRDAEHTVLAMARKRAKGAAVVEALGLADLFEAESEATPAAVQSEPEESRRAPAQGIPIRGAQVVLSEWDLSPLDLKALREELMDLRSLKLEPSIMDAQREGVDVSSVGAFRAWALAGSDASKEEN